MMTLGGTAKTQVARSRPTMVLNDMFDLLDGGFPFSWKSGVATKAIRIEDYIDNERYTIRAELPGLDPDKDLKVSVADGILTIVAERREEKRDNQRSEFHYGSFSRSVALPPSAREDEVTATYEDGLLTVTVALAPELAETRQRTIPVQHLPSETT